MESSRMQCLCFCLAIALSWHGSEAAEIGEVVGLASEAVAEGGSVVQRLQALGHTLRGVPASKVHTVLSESFRPSMWSSWEKEAVAQNLDASASAAVLTSYLCADDNDGSKVMHVVNWVKHTQQMRAHTSSRARLQHKVNVLQQRVQDTQMLMKQSPSAEAAKLARVTQNDLMEAQGQLQQKDRKLEKLKKVAAAKKAHADKLTKMLAAKTGKKGKSKAKTGKKGKSSKAAKLVQLQKVAAVKKAHADKLTKMVKQQKAAKKKALKAKAHRLAKTAAKLNEKAHSAQADATVLKKKAAAAEKGAQTHKLSAKVKAAADLKLKARIATRAADAAAKKVKSLKNGSNYRATLEAKAKKVEEKTTKVSANAKKILSKAQAKQAKQVKLRVAAAEKVRLAVSTLQHAKATKDQALIANSKKLVLGAKLHAHKVAMASVKTGAALKQAAERLQKIGAKEGKKLSGVYKDKIRRIIEHATHLRKRARRVLKAHRKEKRSALRTARRTEKQASAAMAASQKAEAKANKDIGIGRALDHKADKIQKLAEPLEDAVEDAKLKVKHSIAELKLARESKQADAINLAIQHASAQKKALIGAVQKLKALGGKPETLRDQADEMRKDAHKEDQISLHAKSAAKEMDTSVSEAKKAAKASQTEINNLKMHYMPKVLRHTSRAVRMVEHDLARQLHKHAPNVALDTGAKNTPNQKLQKQNAKLKSKLKMESAAAKINVIRLQKIRNRLANTRKTAEAALVKAKRVEHATVMADKQISQLKAKACGQVKVLEAKLASKAKGKKAAVELELARARKACKKAGATLASARLQLNKQAKDVAIAAHEAQRLEAKYAHQDEKSRANSANLAARKAAMIAAQTGVEHEKLASLEAMIKHAKGKSAEADLMARAAKKTKNHAALETAHAASAAAATQLGKLQAAKKKVEAKIVGSKKRLGELHSSIRSEARRIKDDETDATEQHNALMTEQNTALKESVGTEMQHRMDKLTVKLAKETSLRESLESKSNQQKAAQKKTVAQLSAKLHAADAAAVAVIQMIKKFIRNAPAPRGPRHTGKAARRDLRLAHRQEGELGSLEERARRKVSKSRSKLKLARASMVPRAVRLARRLMDKAEGDLRKVRAAMEKVRSRARADKRDLRRIERSGQHNNGLRNRDVSSFAQRIVAKWEHVHRLAFQEQKPSSNNNAQLEQRIAALEAALRAEGGKMHQMEAAKIQARINVATKKLRLMEEKMRILRKIYAAGKKRGDKHGMIKAGTEEKDLSVACDKQKKLIQDLYRKLKAAQNAPAPKVLSVPMPAPAEEKAEASPEKEPKKKATESKKETLIRAKEKALRKAKRAAKSASQRAKSAHSHVKTAMKKYKKHEHEQEKRARKEVKAAAKDNKAKKAAVKKAQAELDAAKKKGKKEKKKNAKKAKKLKKKMAKEKAVQKKAEKKQAKLKKAQEKLKKKTTASKKKSDKLAAKAGKKAAGKPKTAAKKKP